MPDLTVLGPMVEKLTLVAGLAWAVVALARGWVVPASVVDTLRADRDQWMQRADRASVIAEAALKSKLGQV